MEAVALEESPKKIIMEFRGESHTLMNVLKREMWDNEHIKIATYHINHPLLGVPQLIIETDGNLKPRKAISDAAQKVKKDVEKFTAAFDKA